MNDEVVGLGNGEEPLANEAAPAAAKRKKQRGTVTADADLTAMAKISNIINNLDASDRARVVDWFAGKYAE